MPDRPKNNRNKEKDEPKKMKYGKWSKKEWKFHVQSVTNKDITRDIARLCLVEKHLANHHKISAKLLRIQDRREEQKLDRN
ncbi:hypothetical protein K7X08_035406 [Anisodus acutangulus]|uniref:Uncharacterized protein n=1 Tax=Anisodus acutangulus TaxID=402998 RepID=A0A9Q1LKF7_9SOLA|nr:hypothetical protein K7X08_035406 [Anisodus acutangulus]